MVVYLGHAIVHPVHIDACYDIGIYPFLAFFLWFFALGA